MSSTTCTPLNQIWHFPEPIISMYRNANQTPNLSQRRGTGFPKWHYEQCNMTMSQLCVWLMVSLEIRRWHNDRTMITPMITSMITKWEKHTCPWLVPMHWRWATDDLWMTCRWLSPSDESRLQHQARHQANVNTSIEWSSMDTLIWLLLLKPVRQPLDYS